MTPQVLPSRRSDHRLALASFAVAAALFAAAHYVAERDRPVVVRVDPAQLGSVADELDRLRRVESAARLFAAAVRGGGDWASRWVDLATALELSPPLHDEGVRLRGAP